MKTEKQSLCVSGAVSSQMTWAEFGLLDLFPYLPNGNSVVTINKQAVEWITLGCSWEDTLYIMKCIELFILTNSLSDTLPTLRIITTLLY